LPYDLMQSVKNASKMTSENMQIQKLAIR
jgi:hypothetical protein